MINFDYFAAAQELIVLLKQLGHKHEAEQLQTSIENGSTGTEIFMALRFNLVEIVKLPALDDESKIKAARLLAELSNAIEA